MPPPESTPDQFAQAFMDERRVRELVAQISKLESSVSAIAEKLGAVRDTSVALFDRAKDSLSDTSKKSKDIEDQMIKIEGTIGGMDKVLSHIKGTFADMGVTSFQHGIEGVGRAMLGLQTSAEGTIRSFVSGIPYIGPFIEMMLNSAKKMAEFTASGQRSFLGFERTQFIDPAQIEKSGTALGKYMESLEHSFLATRQEVERVFSTFAQGGAKAEQVTKNVNLEIEGFGKTLAETSLGLDRAFQLAAGTFAGFETQLAKTTNVALTDTASIVEDIGIRARAAGMDMQMFMGTILDVTSALRVQGGDAKSLSATYLDLQTNLKGMLGKGQDIRANELATEAMKGIPAAIQGMPKGMQGLIAQDVAMKMTGQRMGKLEAYVEMMTGFVGKTKEGGPGLEQAILSAEFDKIRRQTNDPVRQQLMLQQFGQSPILAKMAVETQGRIFDPRSSGITDEQRKKFQDELNKAKENQPLNISSFTRGMQGLENVFQRVGEAMLSVLQAILKTLVAGLLTLTGAGGFDRHDFARVVGGEFGKLKAKGEEISSAFKGSGLDKSVAGFFDFSDLEHKEDKDDWSGSVGSSHTVNAERTAGLWKKIPASARGTAPVAPLTETSTSKTATSATTPTAIARRNETTGQLEGIIQIPMTVVESYSRSVHPGVTPGRGR